MITAIKSGLHDTKKSSKERKSNRSIMRKIKECDTSGKKAEKANKNTRQYDGLDSIFFSL